jgi:formate dehydrogenase maturation protein FdhE|tara:strand:+ start:461 stop:622 length:162 start_codon:yes stop_codon:yes gene_type:complete
MKCYACQSELIVGGDESTNEEDEEHAMVTNLSCSVCNAFVIVYWGSKEKKDVA